ncbi:MAG: DUF4290 domain-containing protein [Saprospiraceae bacterium]|nr:DUF4290 domain-containing protein [Saprospiraceae bacterium]
MDYNSQREKLVIPEYGRNVQNLITHAKTIEDKAERQRFVQEIIRLMMQMNPQNKNMDDFRERVWNHLYRIADFDLDVDPPEGIDSNKEYVRKIPEQVPYPTAEHRFRHYGHNVQQLIDKALSMEPGAKQDEFVMVICSYMKLAYRTWNREHFVSDDVIVGDLQALSNGKLTLKENLPIENLTSPTRNTRKRPMGNNSKSSHKGSKGGSKGPHKGGHRSKGGGKRK